MAPLIRQNPQFDPNGQFFGLGRLYKAKHVDAQTKRKEK